MSAVGVLEIKPLAGAGNLRGFAKIRLGCVVIHSCRIIQQPGERPWVSLPQQQSKDGKYFPIVELTNRDVLDRVRDAVLDAWKRRP